MKTIIAGCRHYRHPADSQLIDEAVLLSGFTITEVVSGTAYGIDSKAIGWALRHRIPVREFYAQWAEYGARAGFMRNVDMAEYAEALIAIWDGESKGTAHMILQATKRGLKVYVLDAGL